MRLLKTYQKAIKNIFHAEQSNYKMKILAKAFRPLGILNKYFEILPVLALVSLHYNKYK